MEQKSRLQKAPKSTDLEGWRVAISQASLSTFRLEDIVAAIQDLGPLVDSNVRNPLAKHLSDAMTKLLRKLVRTHHPNRGDDIIYRVHGQLFEALLKPNSADGKGLRQAFTARVSFRVKDAIAAEYQHARIPTEPKVKNTVEGYNVEESGVEEAVSEHAPMTANDLTAGESVTSLHPGRDLSLPVSSSGHDAADEPNESDWDDAATPRNSNRDLSLLDGVRDLDEWIDIERFMQVVPNERKRLAFYLHMDKVPFGSTRGYSPREWSKSTGDDEPQCYVCVCIGAGHHNYRQSRAQLQAVNRAENALIHWRRVWAEIRRELTTTPLPRPCRLYFSIA